MHFLISFGTLIGFVFASGSIGYIGGLYTMAAINRPRKAA